MEPAIEGLRAGTGRASLEHGDMLVVLPDEGLVVTDVSVVHPTTNCILQQAVNAAASARDAAKSRKHGGAGRLLCSLIHGNQRAPSPPGNAVSAALADIAASSAMAGSDVTTSFVTGALHAISVASVRGNEVAHGEALHVHATAGSTAAPAGAIVDPE
jgi:hypothetical protein